jgi:hypothetical protein
MVQAPCQWRMRENAPGITDVAGDDRTVRCKFYLRRGALRAAGRWSVREPLPGPGGGVPPTFDGEKTSQHQALRLVRLGVCAIERVRRHFAAHLLSSLEITVY